MFSEKNIQVLEQVKDWQESIKVASSKLLSLDFIESRYIDAMIESIENLGFYVVLADNIAMPHSRPENGVKNICFFIEIK